MSTTNYLKTALLLGLMTGLILVVGRALGGEQGMLLALGLAAVMNFVSYWFSDKIVLKMYGGREVTPAEAPRFHAIVDRLIVRAELPRGKAAPGITTVWLLLRSNERALPASGRHHP